MESHVTQLESWTPVALGGDDGNSHSLRYCESLYEWSPTDLLKLGGTTELVFCVGRKTLYRADNRETESYREIDEKAYSRVQEKIDHIHVYGMLEKILENKEPGEEEETETLIVNPVEEEEELGDIMKKKLKDKYRAELHFGTMN